MAQKRLSAPQNLPPQVVGSPKHTPQSPLPSTSLAPSCSPSCPLSLPGLLRTSWGLRKPWEPLAALGLQSDSGALLPLLPLTPSCSPSPPEPPWVSLGPWDLRKPLEALGLQSDSEALLPLLPLTPLTLSRSPLPPEPPWAPGTFLGPQQALGAFGSLQQAWVFSQTQGPCFPCSPHPPSLPHTPSHSPHPLSLPGPLGPSWGLSNSKPWEPSEAFRRLGSSVRLRGLASLAPLAPLALSPPEPPWAPGTFLGPQQALGAFRSLKSSVRLRGLASLAPPHPPHFLLHPLSLLGPPWALPGTSGSLGSLQQPWVFSQTQGPCWWLVRVTLVVDWLFAVFAPKFWAHGGDLRKPFMAM